MDQYVKRRKRRPNPRKRKINQQIAPRYTQSTLWKQVTRNNSPKAPPVLLREETQKTVQHQKLLQLVRNRQRKRKKAHQSTLTLSGETNKRARKVMNITQEKMRTRRKRTYAQIFPTIIKDTQESKANKKSCNMEDIHTYLQKSSADPKNRR